MIDERGTSEGCARCVRSAVRIDSNAEGVWACIIELLLKGLLRTQDALGGRALLQDPSYAQPRHLPTMSQTMPRLDD